MTWADQPNAEFSQEQLVFYESHIRPLFARRCYECHAQRTGKAEGGLHLDHRDGWTRGGESGSAIVPKDPAQSLLVKAIRYADSNLQMPPSESLVDEEIEVIEKWIRMGAPAPSDQPTTAVHPHPSDPVFGRSHWAFQPLQNKPAPSVEDTTWMTNPIDCWLQSERQKSGMASVDLARPFDLLRRTCFQLVGLPPTEQQTTKYLQAPSEQNYQELVDELLASPQFGRRWGRHWLDLARYADSNGLDENFLFREAWRYRNWVIEALNDDIPYDQFLTDQIAGDLLPYVSLEQRDRRRIAAGFLVVGPKVLLGVNPQKQRMDVADEQIDTLGRAVLGQTLGCARCHDHKFDPFPTADYYALAGIFTSTQVMEKRFMLNEQRVMERLVGLGPEGEQLDDAYEQFWREQPKLRSRKEKLKTVLETLKSGDIPSIDLKLAQAPDDFAKPALDRQLPLPERIAAQEALLKEVSDTMAKAPPIPPRAMIPSDIEQPVDEMVRKSGRFDDLGDRIPRGFLTVLCADSTHPVNVKQSGRIELAQWLTDKRGPSGWLAARVLANRIWHHLMGQGLVRTVDNLGRTGEAPSHPELLDYLATDLIAGDWSIKRLIRKIVLSRTFQLSCQFDSSNAARDPENRLLWRANRRRLDAESLRDAMLVAAGNLDLGNVDSTVYYLGDQATAVGKNLVRRRTDFNCRSIFLPVIRNDLPELFDAFDFANPQATTGARPATTVPNQGLFMLNDTSVIGASQAMAKRIFRESPTTSLDQRIERLFILALGRPPSAAQHRTMHAFLSKSEYATESHSTVEAAEQVLALACQAVLASSQFQYLD